MPPTSIVAVAAREARRRRTPARPARARWRRKNVSRVAGAALAPARHGEWLSFSTGGASRNVYVTRNVQWPDAGQVGGVVRYAPPGPVAVLKTASSRLFDPPWGGVPGCGGMSRS